MKELRIPAGNLDNQDIANLVASIGSALVMVWGFLAQFLLAIPVGAVLFTALISYFFQRRMQNDMRKYERGRLAVTEALGPVYGILLKIIDTFESNKSKHTLAIPSTFLIEAWVHIWHSHKFYLIRQELRAELERFFLDLFEFQTGIITARITKIGVKFCNTLVKNFEAKSWPRFIVEDENGKTSEASILELIFWDVDPTAIQKRAKLKEVTIEGEDLERHLIQPKRLYGEDAFDFTSNFFKALSDELKKDPDIVKAREMHCHLDSEANRLLRELKEQISGWAE